MCSNPFANPLGFIDPFKIWTGDDAGGGKPSNEILTPLDQGAPPPTVSEIYDPNTAGVDFGGTANFFRSMLQNLRIPLGENPNQPGPSNQLQNPGQPRGGSQ